MSNRRATVQRKGRANVVAARRGQRNTLHQDMMQLMDIQRTQLHGVPPGVRDEKPRIAPARQVYSFFQTILLGTITPSLTADTLGGYAVSLNNIPTGDLTSFTTLFDQWRIKQLSFTFVSLNPSATEAPLYTAIDLDSSTGVTLATIVGYATCQINQGQVTTVRTFTPGTLLAGATTTNLVNAPDGTWIDCASPAQAYYGILYAIPLNAASSATPAYQVQCRVLFQFRNLR